jgi:hypothetical protein
MALDTGFTFIAQFPYLFLQYYWVHPFSQLAKWIKVMVKPTARNMPLNLLNNRNMSAKARSGMVY